MITFTVNSKPVSFDGDDDTPLLWVLRDHFDLTGTKFGCGVGQCGACTVHINGRAQRSCLTPVSAARQQRVTTIEGIASPEGRLHPVQHAWLDTDVPQCGYCQAGQIMATIDFIARNPDPSDGDIDREMSNLCRCGTYVRIREAVHLAAKLSDKENQS